MASKKNCLNPNTFLTLVGRYWKVSIYSSTALTNQVLTHRPSKTKPVANAIKLLAAAIYCHFTVIPWFCVINQCYQSNHNVWFRFFGLSSWSLMQKMWHFLAWELWLIFFKNWAHIFKSSCHTGWELHWGQFVEQKLRLSSSFRRDQNHNCPMYD